MKRYTIEIHSDVDDVVKGKLMIRVIDHNQASVLFLQTGKHKMNILRGATQAIMDKESE